MRSLLHVTGNRQYYNMIGKTSHDERNAIFNVDNFEETTCWRSTRFKPERFNKIAIQGTPQMAVDKEAISLSRVYSYSKCNLPLLGRVHTCSGSRSGPVPAFRSRSGPVPLARVAAFTPAKIDRTRSGCGPVTRSHLFRNATGTRTVTPPPPPEHQVFNYGSVFIPDDDSVDGFASSTETVPYRLTRRCMMCPNFGLQCNFGRCIILFI